MCAEFTLRSSQKEIESQLNMELDNRTGSSEWDLHARLYSPAPILFAAQDRPCLEKYRFSLKPQGTPYPTFNARLAGWDEKKQRLIPIHSRPTWRKPLKETKCVVPLSGFIEPIYLGAYAGSAVEFKSRHKEILFSAGLYEESVDKKTGELYHGFSLILHTPDEYILKIGHHRQLLLLRAGDAWAWIVNKKMSPEENYEYLLGQRYLPELESGVSRRLAKGWEKKVAAYEKKLEKETQFMKRLTERSN